MQPVHAGLGNEALYNAGAMQSVSVCLDSGMRATDACHSDARGMERVVTVMCYAEDVPDGVCTKHVPVRYCVDGEGVANEFCDMHGDANVQTRSLVKLTPAEVREIRDAASSGLVDAYLNNGYVYYVSEGGEDLDWTGFYGNINAGAPYLTCQVHDDSYFGDFEEPGFEEDWSEDDFESDDEDDWDW